MSKETIGPKIKEFRKKRKLTQDELAESLGYSGKSVISHIEKGDADMTYEKILLLLKTYKVDANELFEVDAKIPLSIKSELDIFDACRDSWNWQKKNPNGYDK